MFVECEEFGRIPLARASVGASLAAALSCIITLYSPLDFCQIPLARGGVGLRAEPDATSRARCDLRRMMRKSK